MDRILNERMQGWCLIISSRCRSRVFAGWLCAIYFVVWCVSSVRANEPAFPESQSIFPDTTVAWISIADPEDFGASFDRTQYGKLLRDPSMEAFVTSFREQLSKAGKQRLGKLGLTLEDLGEIPGGEIAMAAIVPEAGRLATVLLVDTSGHEEETEALLEEIEERLLEQKAQRLADYEEKIRVYRLPQEDPSADDVDAAEPEEQVVAVVHEGKALVIGDDLHLLVLPDADARVRCTEVDATVVRSCEGAEGKRVRRGGGMVGQYCDLAERVTPSRRLKPLSFACTAHAEASRMPSITSGDGRESTRRSSSGDDLAILGRSRAGEISHATHSHRWSFAAHGCRLLLLAVIRSRCPCVGVLVCVCRGAVAVCGRGLCPGGSPWPALVCTMGAERQEGSRARAGNTG